jgi:hypothetical protein
MGPTIVGTRLVVTGLNGLGSRYTRQLGSLVADEEHVAFMNWLEEQNSSTLVAPFGTRCLVDVVSQTLLAVYTLCLNDGDVSPYLASNQIHVRGFGVVQVRSHFNRAEISEWLIHYLDSELSAVGGRWALITDDPNAEKCSRCLGFYRTGFILDGKTVLVRDCG